MRGSLQAPTVILLVPLAACGGAEPIPFSPPAISWIHPATLAGTWDYRGYSVVLYESPADLDVQRGQ